MIKLLDDKKVVGKSGWLRVYLDSTGYNKLIARAATDITKLSKDTDVMEDVAQLIVDKAEDSDLVPYRQFYPLRKTKTVKNPKTGKKKVTRKYYNQLYYMKETSGKKRRVYLKEAEDLDHPLPGEYGIVKPDYTQIVYERRRDKNGNLLKETKAGRTKGKGLWKAVSIAKENEGDPLHFQGMKAGTVYADRGPHLIDSYKFVRTSGNRVGIQYSVRKKPNDHWSTHNSGEDYAAFQYFADDTNWKRTSDGSTSRWLEVAMGIPIETNVKGKQFAGGSANRKQILIELWRNVLGKNPKYRNLRVK